MVPEHYQRRFWCRVDKTSSEKGCWLWTGFIDKDGYGRAKGGSAARRSWELTKGRPIPSGKHILHICDVRRCVNPAHLFLGDHQTNMKDAQLKGKMNRIQNPKRWNSGFQLGNRIGCIPRKLTKRSVLSIRKLYSSGNYSQEDLGRRFGVSQVMISRIVRGKNWN